ncbi:hypothetical protein RI367_005498 [Sorochytrium milnesiophthora]
MLSSDGKANAQRHGSSSRIHDALNPSRGIRDDISRRGGTPKNHARENAAKLRQMQSLNKLKKEQDQAVPVSSRVYEPKKSASAAAAAAASASSSQSSLVRSSSATSLASVNAGQHVPERKTALGQVPNLVDRKCQWAADEEERQRKKREEDTWPPGTVPVPESERLETLEYLKTSQATLMSELARFPITLQPSNLSRYRRKQEVEEKLRDVEKSITIFSQAKVFMQRPE